MCKITRNNKNWKKKWGQEGAMAKYFVKMLRGSAFLDILFTL